MADLSKFRDYGPSDTMLARAMRKINQKFFLTTILSDGTTDVGVDINGNIAVKEARPSTATITNVTISDNLWNLVATGLSDVLKWRLSEKTGANFNYAYGAVPAAFVTAFGSIQWDTAITTVYAQRQGDSELEMQLEVWKL